MTANNIIAGIIVFLIGLAGIVGGTRSEVFRSSERRGAEFNAANQGLFRKVAIATIAFYCVAVAVVIFLFASR